MLTPKTPRVDTHKASILYRLLLGHQIKNKEMWNHIDTGYAACRISELRADFWPIDDRRANSNMRCDSLKSLMIINKLSKFL